MIPLISLAIFISSAVLVAQVCTPPTARITPKGTTIFSEAQDVYLGEAASAQMQRSYSIYRQPGLNAPMERIAARILKHLPQNEFKFVFSLIEIPEANAFVLPGGRVFVSRKLIAFVENEDELAGVIAHEMGHVLARQSSVALTREFKEVLKVNEVGDRDDVFARFNELIDNQRRKPRSMQKKVDNEVEADRISLNAINSAGYDGEALARFLDRLTENKGATGGFLSDLFGITRPESKRVRELLKTVSAVPPACREKRSPTEAAEFRTWQKMIAGLSPEALVDESSTIKPVSQLQPALRPDITTIRFSPDSQYVLAQDESGINVARREPFQLLFRIPARDAGPVVVSPDSKLAVFRAGGLRVEVWDLDKRVRRSVTDIVSRGCLDGAPSLDGRFFVCLSEKDGIHLSLLEVESGTEIANSRFSLNLLGMLQALLNTIQSKPANPVRFSFSPDGRYLLASAVGSMAIGDPWAYDLTNRTTVALNRDLKKVMSGSFAFMGANRLVVMNAADPRESGLFEWPGGKLLEKFPVPNAYLDSVASGPFVLLRPFRNFPVAVLNIETKGIFKVSRNPAMDIHGELFASERGSGEIGLYGDKNKLLAAIQLPPGDLGRLRGGAHSADLKWLTISGPSRSGIWGLADGVGGLFDPLTGAYISEEHVLLTEYEHAEAAGDQGFKARRMLMAIDLDQRKSSLVADLPDRDKDKSYMHGRYRVTLGNEEGAKKTKDTSVVVNDLPTKKEMWRQSFAGDVTVRASEQCVIIQMNVADKPTEKLIAAQPELKKRLSQFPRKDGVYLLRVLDIATGKLMGETFVDTGQRSFSIVRATAVNKTLLISDNRNRTQAYTLDTDEPVGRQFGRLSSLDPKLGRICLENTDGDVSIYDGASMKEVAHFNFPAAVSYSGFSGDGRRLLVVTAQQKVYIQPLP